MDNPIGSTNLRLFPAAFAAAEYALTGAQIPHAQEVALLAAMRAVPEYRDTTRMILNDGVRPLKR
jgi:hypothetical protein